MYILQLDSPSFTLIDTDAQILENSILYSSLFFVYILQVK